LKPKKDGQIDCMPDANDIYRCPVSGEVTGISQGQRLLLWVQPVNPPAERDGWYLQRRIVSQSGGRWSGTVQVGNADYPPHTGDIVNVAVSIADEAIAEKLMSTRGVVVQPEPVGATNTIVISDNVRIHAKNGH
jgi:hypothetical protein